MSLKRFNENYYYDLARQLTLLCKADAPLGSVAALLDPEGECHPLLPYRGAGEYTEQGALMLLPSSLDQVHRILMGWQAANFEGRATVEGTLNHLDTELAEVRDAIAQGNIEEIKNEVADLFVLLVQLASLLNVSIGEATLTKLSTLLTRDYSGEPDAEGRITHKKE